MDRVPSIVLVVLAATLSYIAYMARQPSQGVIFAVCAILAGFFWFALLHRLVVDRWLVPRRLRRVLTYEFPKSVVTTFKRDNLGLTPQQTKQAFLGLKQYFCACIVAPRGRKGMPSTLVDSAWHAFLLHSAEYHRFCRRVFGRTLEHHPDENARPRVLTGTSKLKPEVQNTWNALQLFNDRHMSIAAALGAAPFFLFEIDTRLGGGWRYTEEALSNLRANRFAEPDQGGSGSSCGGGCGGSSSGEGGSSGGSDGGGSGSDGGGGDGGSSCGGGCGGD